MKNVGISTKEEAFFHKMFCTLLQDKFSKSVASPSPPTKNTFGAYLGKSTQKLMSVYYSKMRRVKVECVAIGSNPFSVHMNACSHESDESLLI